MSGDPGILIAEIQRVQRHQARLQAQEAALMDQLRSAVSGAGSQATPIDCVTRPVDGFWWDVNDAARAFNLSPSRVATICRGHDLATDAAGFAEHSGRRWRIWPARFRVYMQGKRSN